jgi:hypothetical protein
MNRREMMAGTSIAATGLSGRGIRFDAKDFGVRGDGITDDSSAIQKALDHVGRAGGGAVSLQQPNVHYRITRGLKLPSYVTIEGPAPVHYPYNAGNRGACALVADFADHREWMIEAATTGKEGPFAYNELVTGQLPQGVTYNCGVKNILLTSRGKVPFGGIRMHGCPGAVVEGVSIDRVGCGLLVNYSFGGSYRLMVNTLYYGAAAWDDANANSFMVHCTHASPWPTKVPREYQLTFMIQMQDHFDTTLGLSTKEHSYRPYGILCGSIASTTVGNIFDTVIEHYPGGIFLYNAYSTDIRQCYLEGDRDRMMCGVAASRSRFSVQALHAYLSGTGAVFDFGLDVLAKIFGSGIIHAATFGKAPRDDGSSLLILEGIHPSMPGAPIQRGIRYVTNEALWAPLTLRAGWLPVDDELPAVRLDPWLHRVEFKGSVKGGGDSIGFVLPPRYRPPRLQRYQVPGGQLSISTEGAVRITANETIVSLDSVSFARW